MTTIRLEIKDETGTWLLDILPSDKFLLTFQEVSVAEAKWRCTVASGDINDLEIKLCEQHKHKLPVKAMKQLEFALNSLFRE